MKKPLKFTSRGRFLNALKLNNVARDFENMDLKPFIVLNVLYMTRGMLTIIPKDIRYIVRTLATLSLEHNCIATLDGMYNITFHKLRNLILSHNKISRIAAQLLQLPMVMRINLKDNQLKQLEDMRFSTWGALDMTFLWYTSLSRETRGTATKVWRCSLRHCVNDTTLFMLDRSHQKLCLGCRTWCATVLLMSRVNSSDLCFKERYRIWITAIEVGY